MFITVYRWSDIWLNKVLKSLKKVIDFILCLQVTSDFNTLSPVHQVRVSQKNGSATSAAVGKGDGDVRTQEHNNGVHHRGHNKGRKRAQMGGTTNGYVQKNS